MKLKIYTLIFSLFIFSCSSNSDENNDVSNDNNTNVFLVSKITFNDPDSSSDYSYEENFTYDENKIVERSMITYLNGSVSSTSKTNFVYANDLILRADSYDFNDNLSQTYSLQYDSQGRLTVVENCYYYNGNCSETTTSSISYSSNGTVSITDTNSFSNDEEEQVFQLDNQGNIVDANFQDGDCEGMVSVDYDNNNSPFKNIIGANSLFVAFENLGFTDAPIIGFYNNVLALQTDYVCDNSSDNSSNTSSFSYDYNQEGYPRNIVATESGTYTTTVLLEYN